MVAYLDLIILENVCMNYLILYTTGRLLKRKQNRLRLLVASILGSLYVFSLYVNLPNYIINISKIVIAGILVKIGFNSIGAKNLAKETLVFLFVSFVYAGCTLGFVHCVKPKVMYMVNGIIIGGDYIFEILLISALVSLILIKLVMNIIKLKSKLTKKDMICELTIYIKETYIKVKSLMDTGNLLTDPISKDPVIIVEKNAMKNLIPINEMQEIEQMMGGDKNFKTDNLNGNIRIIPYMSLGNKDGIIPAYKVDKVKVEYQDEIYEINNVLIGIYKDALTKNNKYSALIGLHILERSNTQNEYNSNIEDKSKYSVC